MGYQPPIQDWMGFPPPHPGLDGVPHLSRTGWGTPLSRTGWDIPPHPHPGLETEKHSEHLLRGGRYASSVHAGGLSFLWWLSFVHALNMFGYFRVRHLILPSIGDSNINEHNSVSFHQAQRTYMIIQQIGPSHYVVSLKNRNSWFAAVVGTQNVLTKQCVPFFPT